MSHVTGSYKEARSSNIVPKHIYCINCITSNYAHFKWLWNPKISYLFWGGQKWSFLHFFMIYDNIEQTLVTFSVTIKLTLTKRMMLKTIWYLLVSLWLHYLCLVVPITLWKIKILVNHKLKHDQKIISGSVQLPKNWLQIFCILSSSKRITSYKLHPNAKLTFVMQLMMIIHICTIFSLFAIVGRSLNELSQIGRSIQNHSLASHILER